MTLNHETREGSPREGSRLRPAARLFRSRLWDELLLSAEERIVQQEASDA